MSTILPVYVLVVGFYIYSSTVNIRPVKTEWWGAGMVICLERVAVLHMAHLMSLPLTVSE